MVHEDHSASDCGAGRRITVVTVTYNSSAVLPEMLRSIPKAVSVIVVDNASEDADKTYAIATGHGAQVVLNQANIGFGRACNLGAARADTDLILFLNPDAVVVDGALDSLANAADSYPRASAFNPAIESSDGRQLFRRSSPIDPKKRKRPRRGWPANDQEVPILSGAALLVRRADFSALGGFDPAIFLYHEDDDLCLRLRASRGPLMFIRNARIVHDHGNSSGSDPEILHQRCRSLGYSRVYAALKHGKPMAFERALIEAAGGVCSPVMIFSARARVKRPAYLQGVLSARHLNPPLFSRMRKRANP